MMSGKNNRFLMAEKTLGTKWERVPGPEWSTASHFWQNKEESKVQTTCQQRLFYIVGACA